MSNSSHALFGAPCWVSLLTRDLRAAEDFYRAVLGWEFRSTRLGEEFSAALFDGVPVAGIGALAASLSAPVAWIPYFAVDKADLAASRIRERSATIAVGPLRLGTGRAALAADRDGAVFGIWEGVEIPDWTAHRHGTPVWLELHTRNAFESVIFYAEVLLWADDRPQSVQVAYEDDRVVLRHGGRAVAQIIGGAVEAAPDPRVRPRWHVHFEVDDVRAAVRAATRLGGSVVEPVRSDGARTWAALRDPDGGMFTVTARGA
ncbi:VOC family protein [Streptomyces sp. NPDC093970]|uniref:VOC family protein n=1 Tax=Streptomyces sp. NPDC093970 TaxID=3155076 RepID=UPI0034430A94